MSYFIPGGFISDNKNAESSDSDDEQNESTFSGVQPEFKNLVRMTKNQLYTCIVKGQPITSKKAQDNTLLIDYLSRLNTVYQLCETVHTTAWSPQKIEKKLSTFPLQTHDVVKQLLTWLTDFYNTNQYVDTIPYHDYLEVQLRRYPFLQK